MDPRRAAGYALVAFAASSWGTWPLFLRHAESFGPVPPALESAMAMGVVTLASAPVCLVDRVRTRPSPWQWAGVAWLGAADAMNVILVFGAFQATSVAVAVLTHYLAPLFVAMLAPVFLRERLSIRTLGAMAVSFVGLGLLLAPGRGTGHGREWLGASLGAGSAVFYASNVMVNKKLAPAFSGSELAFFHGIIATPILVALAPHGAWAALPRGALIGLLAGSVIAGAAGGLCFVWGLRRIEATRAAGLTFLEPLVAVASAWLVLHEPLSLARAGGGVLILAASAWVIAQRG